VEAPCEHRNPVRPLGMRRTCARADTASAARITLAICSGEHSPRTMAAAQARRAFIATWFVTTILLEAAERSRTQDLLPAVNAAAKGSRGRRAYAGLGTSRNRAEDA